ncbi:MAG: CARDB domain-containing protein [archaeon]
MGKSLSFFMILLIFLPAISSIINLEKDVYELGEIVTVELNTTDFSSLRVDLVSAFRNYTYFEPAARFRYIAPYPGIYTILLFNNTEKIEEKSFTVEDPNKVNIWVDKANYTVGEQVRIKINATSYNDLLLEINSEGISYNFLGPVRETVLFNPKTYGLYEIMVTSHNTVMANLSILVFPKEKKVVEPAVNETTNARRYFTVSNRLNQVSFTNITITDTRSDKIYEINSQSNPLLPDSTYDVEMAPKIEGMKKIVFHEVNLSRTFDLKIENVDKKNAPKDSVRTFAIDPSSIDFSYGDVQMTAAGEQLVKCKEWDFRNQECTGEWVFVQYIKQGEEYTIRIDNMDPAFAEVGVATVNSIKPMYHTNELAEFIIVALDNQGILAENPDITLVVSDPLSNKTIMKRIDGEITGISRGVYYASYDIKDLEGNYSLFVTITAPGINNTLYSHFEVSDNYEFDILRDMPASIDPAKGGYETKITLKANYFTGNFDFTEKLPLNFTIINAGGSTVTSDSNNYYLKWSNLANNSVVSYKANSPPETPQLYEIGMSYIDYSGQTFKEARPWYLAIDPPYSGDFYLFWVGSTNEPAGWTCVSCNSSGAYYQKLIRASDVYGGTGGATTHIHTISYVSETGATTTGQSASSTSAATAAHTHGALANTDVERVSNLPSFRQVKVIKYAGGIPSTIPQGAIAIFNTSSLPSGWTRYTSQDNYFVYANTSANYTAGSNTHSHQTSAGLDISIGFGGTKAGTPTDTVAANRHTHSAGTADSSVVDNRPPYLGVILAMATTDTTVPYGQGFIAILGSTAPSGWVPMSSAGSAMYNRYIVGASSFGSSTGGTTDHTHSDLDITTGQAGTSLSTKGGNNAYTPNTHTHVVTVSFDTITHLPPYINVTFAYANEIIGEVPDTAPNITLITPANYSNSTTSSVDFSCLAKDSHDIVNISFYTNITGTFQRNSTVYVYGSANTSYTATFHMDLSNGTRVIWNCLVFDNATSPQSAWASANWTVTVLENPLPKVNLISPATGSTQINTTLDFNCSATDDEDIQSLSLYTNRTGAFSFEEVQVYSGTSDTSVSQIFTKGGFEDGKGYAWNCKAIDNESNEIYATQNYSFSIYLGIPNITLTSPADNYVDADGTMTLSCIGYDNADISSITLYHDISGSFTSNFTANINGLSDTSAAVVFNLTGVPYGTRFHWNCLVTDNRSQTAFAAHNRSVAVAKKEDFYGNLPQGTWELYDQADGYPDGTYAVDELDNSRYISVDNFTGVPTVGTLLTTYLSLRWYTSNSGDDPLDMGYSLADYDSGNLNLDGTSYDGSTQTTNFPIGSPQNQSYQITGSLSASDLANIRLRVMGDWTPSKDNIVAYIDSLFLSILFDYYPGYYGISKSPTTVYQNTSVTFFTNFTDDYFLSCYIFSINQTGTWINSSCISFGSGVFDAQANYTWFINATPSSNVQWRFYANDSRGQFNQTPMQTFKITDADDIIKPTISNEKVLPLVNSSGSIFNISATITDNNQVDRAYVLLSRPDGQAVNYSMSSSGDYWYYYYTGQIGGNYSFSIIAFDNVNNTNLSQTRPKFNVTSVIFTDHRYYQRGDSVIIDGNGYSASTNADLNIIRSNKSSVSGYPTPIMTNVNGSFATSWTIPALLSQKLGNYTIEANDTATYLKNSTEILVVVKSDISTKYDNNYPSGSVVTQELNHSDSVTTTVVSASSAAYVDLRFQNQIQEGYTLNDLVLYVRHQDYDATSDPIVIQYYNGATYITATCGSIPFSASNTIGRCNLTANLGSIPNHNDIQLRLTDNNAGPAGSDFTKLDFVYLDIDFSITNTLAVEILEPTSDMTTMDYTDAINNNAYEGSSGSDPNPPASLLGGSEADATDYSHIEASDDDPRWQSIMTTKNDHIYQSFYFYSTISESDIVDISVTWEGYLKTDAAAENFRIYAWNYLTSAYTDIGGGTITGTTYDQTKTQSIPGTIADYVDSDGEINVVVWASSKLSGSSVRQDIFTDYIKLDISTIKTIFSYQDINISAVDADGVQSCTVNFINSSLYKYPNINTTKLTDYSFYNRTYTPDYSDGLYNITANCTDGSERKLDSVRIRIYNQGPNVTLVAPLNGIMSTVNDLNFTWNATQQSGTPICNLKIDGIVNISGVNSPSGTYITRQVDNIADGVHQWNVTCQNTAGIPGYSITRNFTIDTAAPTVTHNSPSNNTVSSTNNFTFKYTPTDFGLLNCSLIIDGRFNQTNLSLSANNQHNFTLNNMAAGQHNWSAYCTDSFNYTGNGGISYFKIDLKDPTVVLNFPLPNDIFLGGLVQFNYTAYDDYDSSLTCGIMVNGVVEIPGIPSANATPIVQSKEIGSGTKYWNVTCMDDSGRQNTSETRKFTVNGNPTVQLNLPANRTSLNQNDVSLIYTPDDTDGIRNCSLYVNQIYNSTNISIVAELQNNFTLYNIAENYYNWSVACFDNSTGYATSGAYKFTIDRTEPNITLLGPAPGSFFETGDIYFNFTVIDNLDSSLTCTLYIDGPPRSAPNTDFAALNGSYQSRLETGISGGSHIWDVSCYDDSGLVGYTDSWGFDVGGLPIVALFSPVDGGYSKGNVSFRYYVYDSDLIGNCSLYINDQFSQENLSIDNDAYNSFNLTDMSEQYLNWTVYCTDSLFLTGTDDHYYLHIDNTPPSVTLNHPNSETSTSSTILFNFSIVENSQSSIVCNITVNNTVVDLNFAGTNGTNTRSVGGFTAGQHFWNATCADEAGWVTTSASTYSFTIVQAPTLTLDSPISGSVDTDGNASFRFQVNNADIQNCTVRLNGQLNETIYSSEIIAYGISEINVSNIDQGIHNWTVQCINDAGFGANATPEWNLHVDWQAPNITLSQPENGTNVSLSLMTFNFTAFDNVDDYLSCNLTINNQLNQTNMSAQNGVPFTKTVNGFKPGTYYWNVTCTDGALMNVSPTYEFTISSQPTVELISPDPGHLDGDGNINFTYIPSTLNETGFIYCRLYIDGLENQTNSSLTSSDNGIQMRFYAESISQGFHNWSVYCMDQGSQSGQSETRNFTVDLIDPTIFLNYPIDITLNSSFEFNFSAVDNLAQTLTCSINNNGTLHTGIIAQNGSWTSHSVSGLTDGMYWWNVTCADTGGRTNTSLTYIYAVNETPKVSLISPADFLRTRQTNFNFSYTPTDNSNLLTNCELIINGAVNKTNTTIYPGQPNNFSVANFGNGEYIWTINCTDPAGRIGTSPAPYTLRVDLIGPQINLIFPTEGGTYNFENVNFTWNATDNWATNLYCNISIDDRVNVSTIPVISGTISNQTVINLAQGKHNYSIQCVDNLNNSAFSDLMNFTINAPDLTLNTSHITFNNSNPDENETLMISATIYNIGGATATNIPVEFWNGLPGTGYRIEPIRYIATLLPSQTATVNVSWNITIGMHDINVLINYTAAELNYSNNNATRNISVLKSVLNSPATNQYTNIAVTPLNITLSDFTGFLINYTVFVDGTPSLYGNATDGVSKIVNITLSEGSKIIIVQATDYLGRKKNATSIIRIVDLTKPTLGFINPTPENNSVTAFTNRTINISHIETYPDTMILYVNGQVNQTWHYIGASTNTTLFNLTDGIYYYYAWANDSASNSNVTSTYNFRIDLLDPNVTLNTPYEGSELTSSAVVFSYNVTDSSYLANCTLFINEQANYTSYNVLTNKENTFVKNLADGYYNWSVNCTDQVGRMSISSTRNFSVSHVNPNWMSIWYETWNTHLTGTANINLSNQKDTSEENTSQFIPAKSLFNMVTAYSPYLSGNGVLIPQGAVAKFAGVYLASTARGYVTWKVYSSNSSGDFLIAQNGNDNTGGTNIFTPVNRSWPLSGSSLIYNPWLLGPTDRLKLVVNIYNDDPLGQNFEHSWDDKANSYVNFTNFNVLGDITVNISNPSSDIGISPSQSANITCSIDCTFGVCINAAVYLQYNDSVSDWINMSSTGNLILGTGETNPHTLGNISGVVNSTFVVNGTAASINNVRCYVKSDYVPSKISNIRGVTVVDLIPPTVTLSTPKNDSWNNTASIFFQYTPTDNIALDTCTLYINGAANSTNRSLTNGVLNNFTLASFSQAHYNYSIVCNDTSGNLGNSSTYLFTIDTTKATINLISPQSYDNMNSSTVQLNYSAIDNLDDLLSCDLTVDSAVRAYSIPSQNNSVVATLVSGLYEGQHSWNVTCVDNATNRNYSDTRAFNIFTAPNITLITPLNNNWTNIPTVTFYYNVSDETGIENCSLILNNQINITNHTAEIINNATNSFAVNNLNGTYSWAVQCFDNTTLNKYTISSARILNVDIDNPIPVIITNNHTWYNYVNPIVSFSIIDNLANPISYTFHVNGLANKSSTASNATASQTALNIAQDGAYYIILQAQDNAYNFANSSTKVIYVDTKKPTVGLIFPEDGATTGGKDVTFNYTVYDNMASQLTCNITIDTSVHNPTTLGNDSNNVSVVYDLLTGIHFWNVTCMDLAGNVNTSLTRNFTVPQPDFTLNSSDIRFNTTWPEESKNITINATIYNIGNSNSYNVTVQFFERNYSLNNQIGDNITVDLLAQSSVVVNVSWKVSGIGDIPIYVVIDPPLSSNGTFAEQNESNNYAFKVISVSSYHVFYGNYSGNLSIQDSENKTVYSWQPLNITGANIYAVDYDANINWMNLTALGRSKAGAPQFDDFGQLDAALLMENNSDSINRTWTENNAVKLTDTFTVFTNFLNNVPIMNSTNTSNFITGILWDNLDPSAGGRFDGSQDVVFVTKVNEQKAGSRGIYDFELKVPVNLKLHKGSNYNTIVLYTEIKG